MQILKNLYNSSLFKSVLVYGSTSALNKAIPFLMVPVFTRYLSPQDYGILAMFGVVLSVMSICNGFSVLNIISIKYFQRDKIDLASYVGNCFLLLACSTAIISVFLLVFEKWLLHVTDLPAQWIWIALLTSLGSFASSILLSLWQSAMKKYHFSAFQLLQTAASVAFSVLFVVGLGMDWQGRGYAQLLVALVFAVISLYCLLRSGWFRFEINRGYLRDALLVSLPIIPHAMAGFIIDTTDRIMITNMVGISDTGIYSVGAQIGMIMLFITASFNMAWVPWLYDKLKNGDSVCKEKIVSFTYLYCLALLLLAVSLGYLAPWFFSVFIGKEFTSGSGYVFWIALGYAFNGMYMMVTNYLFYAEKTYLVSTATFASALVNVAASYLLIKMNGAIGAAQGAMLAHLCSFLLTWYFSARVYPMPWTWNFRRI